LLTRDAISLLQSNGEQWISGLELISHDVVNDVALRSDQILVRDLFDYAFAALKEKGIEALESALGLLAFLNDQQLRHYIDRALDTLITYEASPEPLDRMEPFLRLLESPASRLTADEVRKAARFCRRLLGPANRPEEQSRAIRLISTLNHVELVHELHDDLERLSTSENKEIAKCAEEVLRPLGEGPNPLQTTSS
jgi:hypothetical protein